MTAAVVAVACAAGPVLAGCGSVSPGAPPVTLTASDTGRTVHAVEGARVDVTLRPPQGYAAWRAPTSSDPAVLRSAGGGGGSAGRRGEETKASFTALRPGRSTLHSDTHVACPPGRICPALAQAWTVVVTVDRR
ncbi:MAG: hypothetical protein LBJ87_12060 [bacterium]|nr:hypothetical protein [bacterium]